MDRNLLLHQLALHRPFDSYEAGFLKRTEQFVKSTPQCFIRSNLAGHVTGSAWPVSAVAVVSYCIKEFGSGSSVQLAPVKVAF